MQQTSTPWILYCPLFTLETAVRLHQDPIGQFMTLYAQNTLDSPIIWNVMISRIEEEAISAIVLSISGGEKNLLFQEVNLTGSYSWFAITHSKEQARAFYFQEIRKLKETFAELFLSIDQKEQAKRRI